MSRGTGADAGTASAAGGLIGSTTVPISSPNASVSIDRSFATGRVAPGLGVVAGGLIGSSTLANPLGTLVTQSYWDTLTTGQTVSATTGGSGALGQNTTQLQSALPPGFTSAVWGIIPGSSYPYLKSQHPSGPLVVSGTLTTGTSLNPGGVIAGKNLILAAGGSLRGQATTGANGYYYFTTQPLTAMSSATVFRTGATSGSATSDAPAGSAAISALDVSTGLLVRTAQATSSGLAALLATGGDSRLSSGIGFTAAGGSTPLTFTGGPVVIEATNPNGFVVDRSITLAQDLFIGGARTFTTTGPAGSSGLASSTSSQALVSGSSSGGTASQATELKIAPAASLSINPTRYIESTGGQITIVTSKFPKQWWPRRNSCGPQSHNI